MKKAYAYIVVYFGSPVRRIMTYEVVIPKKEAIGFPALVMEYINLLNYVECKVEKISLKPLNNIKAKQVDFFALLIDIEDWLRQDWWHRDLFNQPTSSSRVSIDVGKRTADELKSLSIATGRSVGSIIRDAIRTKLENKTNEHWE